MYINFTVSKSSNNQRNLEKSKSKLYDNEKKKYIFILYSRLQIIKILIYDK